MRARNLATELLILQAAIAPALVVDTGSQDSDDLELWVARQAMNVTGLSRLCDELAAQILGPRAEGPNRLEGSQTQGDPACKYDQGTS